MKKLISVLLLITTLLSSVAIVCYAESEYAITITEQCSTTNKVDRSYSYASATAKVTLIVNVHDGYEMESISAKSAGGIVVSLTEVGENVFTFIMPSSEVFIDIIYKQLYVVESTKEETKLTEEEIKDIYGEATKIDTGSSEHEVYVVVKPGTEDTETKSVGFLKGFFGKAWVRIFFIIFDIILLILLIILYFRFNAKEKYFEEKVEEPVVQYQPPIPKTIEKNTPIITPVSQPIYEEEKPKKPVVCPSSCTARKCTWCGALVALYIITAIHIGFNIGKDKKDGRD